MKIKKNKKKSIKISYIIIHLRRLVPETSDYYTAATATTTTGSYTEFRPFWRRWIINRNVHPPPPPPRPPTHEYHIGPRPRET